MRKVILVVGLSITAALPAFAQTSSTFKGIQQNSTASCSPPILGNNGTVSITCYGVGSEAQAYLEGKLSELLKQVQQIRDVQEITRDDGRTIRNQNDLIDTLRQQAESWAKRYREELAKKPSDEVEKNARELIKNLRFDEAQAILQQEETKEQPDLARAASTETAIASISILKFDWKAAFPHLEKAFNYQPENIDYADMLGLAAYFTGNYSAAERGWRTSLRLYRELATTDPKNNQQVATILNNLGNVYAEANRNDEAEKSLLESLKIRRELAQNDPTMRSEVASSLSNLAIIYDDTDRKAQAEQFYKDSIATYRQIPPGDASFDPSRLAGVLNSIGVLYYYSPGRGKDALSAYKESIEIYRRLASQSPEYNIDLAMGLLNMGLAYDELNQEANADPPYNESISILEEFTKDKPIDYLAFLSKSLIQLGDHYVKFNANQKAESAYLKVLNIRRRQTAEDPHWRGPLYSIVFTLAELYDM
jgi:tetratricopeptide (TPR) repeat protein